MGESFPPRMHHIYTKFINIQMVSQIFPVCRPSHFSYLGRPHTVPLIYMPHLTPYTLNQTPRHTQCVKLCSVPSYNWNVTFREEKNMCKTWWRELRFAVWRHRILCVVRKGARSGAGMMRKHGHLWRQGQHRRGTTLRTISPNHPSFSLSIVTCRVCVLQVCLIEYAE